jgi:cell division septum initiation protein DivIVA
MNRDDLLETIVRQTGMIMDLTKGAQDLRQQIEDLRQQIDSLQKQNDSLRALRSSTITSATSSVEQTPTSPAASVPHVALSSSYVHRPSVPPSASSSVGDGDGDGDGDSTFDTVSGPIRRKYTRFQYQCPCGQTYIIRKGDYRNLYDHREYCKQNANREDGVDDLHKKKKKKKMESVYGVLRTYQCHGVDVSVESLSVSREPPII